MPQQTTLPRFPLGAPERFGAGHLYVFLGKTLPFFFSTRGSGTWVSKWHLAMVPHCQTKIQRCFPGSMLPATPQYTTVAVRDRHRESRAAPLVRGGEAMFCRCLLHYLLTMPAKKEAGSWMTTTPYCSCESPSLCLLVPASQPGQAPMCCRLGNWASSGA